MSSDIAPIQAPAFPPVSERWKGPNVGGLPKYGSKDWLEARLARSEASAPANTTGPLGFAAAEPLSEAAQIAYDCGIKGVGPVAQRVIDLEGLVAELFERIARLENKRH
jgi:hypothetical protein